MAVADGAGETCAPAECICLATAGTCYRKCNAELDCKPGFTCDPTQQLCKPAGDCTTDAFCATLKQEVTAKCVTLSGAASASCEIPCHIDQDCSPSGLSSSGFNGKVCGVAGYSGSLGCTSDAECSLDLTGASGIVLGSVKMFCAAKPAGTSVQWTSAITD